MNKEERNKIDREQAKLLKKEENKSQNIYHCNKCNKKTKHFKDTKNNKVQCTDCGTIKDLSK